MKMKKINYLFLLVLTCCYSLKAQNTTLVIDNQTPGWLSSKINYSDQLTVQNLTVTGYLNKSDLEFIGTLIVNQTLNKKLDLTNSNIIGEDNSKNDQLWENAFNINWTSDGNNHIEFLSLPSSLTGSINCLGRFFSVDTLVAGSFSMHKIEKTAFSCENDGRSYNWNIKHVVLREGTDSIMDMTFGKSSALSANEPQLQTILFPSTMKYIGKGAFYKCAQLYTLSLPDSIEEIYDQAFSGCGYSSDTLFLPKSLKKYHMRAIPKAKVIYFSKNIEYVDNYYSTYSNSTNTTTGHDVISNTNIKELHIESSIPPKFRYNYYKTLSECTIYVPKGSAKLYKEENYFPSSYNPWSYAQNIIEEIRVEGVKINNCSNMYVGERQTVTVSITPDDALNKNIQWSSSNENIATISSKGEIVAHINGNTTISAQTEDGNFVDSINISIFNHTTAVSISNTSVQLKIGDKKQLTAQTLPLGTSDSQITWSSNDDDIATVDENGNVKGITKGTCTITATSVDGGYTKECVVTVVQPIQGIQLEKHETNLKVGESEELRVQVTPIDADNKNIKWTSEDETIATVNEEGVVTGVKSGKVRIYATSEENSKILDYCTVTIIQPVTGITLDKQTVELTAIGECIQLQAIVLPEDAENKNVKWSSSNEAVCKVSENGLVTAVGVGNAAIMVSTEDGIFVAHCLVNIILKVTEVSLEKRELALKVGESEELRIRVTPNDANNKNIKWTSEDETIATVNEDGVVTGVKSGKVRIYATSEENSKISDYCTVTIIQPVTGITLDKQTVELTAIGECIQLQATVLPEDAENKNVKWSSSNEKVCIVSGNGTIVGLSDGVAIIIATTEEGGFLATCQVTVNTVSGIKGTTDNLIRINVNGNSIYIANKSANDIVVIYSAIGEIIYKGYDDRVVLSNGVYIVKVGNLYHKIII